MGVTSWAQLLHFYQPPTQSHEVLARVAAESYRPVLAVLREHPAAAIAININAVLTEMLRDHGMGDIVAALRELGERGQVEFTGSGRFHPILPLIPESERRRSIAEQAASNGALLGARPPAGFFSPELCYSAETAAAAVESGCTWMALSGVACPVEWPTRVVHRAATASGPAALLFRDDARSNRISFRETDARSFVRELAGLSGDGGDAYVFTAMDAETFGHHIRGWEREFLAEAYRVAAEPRSGVRMAMPSDVAAAFPRGATLEPHASSWSTTREDIAAGNPYPLWKAPGNTVHDLQWEYVEHCASLTELARAHGAGEGPSAVFRRLADEGLQPALHSCQFWWASRRPWWDVPMIQRGFLLLQATLLNAAKAVTLSDADDAVKREVEWRVAAAGDIRARLERMLFLEIE